MPPFLNFRSHSKGRIKTMKLKAVFLSLAAAIVASLLSQASAETVQTPANVFGGRPFLYVEGESASTITGAPGATWKVVTKGGPDLSVGGALPVLPNTTNASGGGAIWAPTNNFTDHSTVAQYQLKFITAGTYQFYPRLSLYDSNNNTNFLNEDSVYLPPAFNKNSGTDWIGFSSLEFDENDVTVDIPTPGFSLDPDGWKTTLGDHDRDGLLELANWGIKDKGVWTQHTPQGTLAANGNFNWYNRPAYQGTKPPVNTFDGFFGKKTEFTVTPDMVGQTVTFDVGLREVNVVFDGFLFINTGTPADIYPNSDLLDLYTQAEVDAAVLPQPIAGDYNNNGVVDAADYVLWRNGGPLQNEVDNPGTVTAADYTEWRARFGNPGSGSGAGSSAIPEPSGMTLCLLGLTAMQTIRRRRGR